MHAIFSKPAPPSGVSDSLRVCPVMRRKGCEPARIESFHQYLWVNSRVRLLAVNTDTIGHTQTNERTHAHNRTRVPTRFMSHIPHAQVQWNIALMTRVLEEGVYIPPLGSMSELLSNPSTRALFSRLAPFLRQPLDRARICATTITTTSSESSSSSSSWSPEASAQEETILGLQQSSMDLDIELQEMMRALRSPAPSPSTGPPADDHERWLL